MTPKKIRAPLVLISLLAFQGLGFAAINVIANGGFETNGGPGTNGFSNWSAVVQPGSQGSWLVQNGTVSPVTKVGVPAPPEGLTAAMTDGSGPGTHALLQTFTVPVAQSVTLTFRYFRLMNSSVPGFAAPQSLDFTQTGNQQARVDILTSAAGAFDLGGSVLLNAFKTLPGDSRTDSAYQTFSMDITSTVAAGGTFQLRIVEVDNVGQFQFGVDNVAVNVVPSPDLTITKTHSAPFNAGDRGDLFAITVSNIAAGSVASGVVTVTDTLPAGLTPASIGGSGWSCSPITSVPLTCTRSDALAGGSSYPQIQLSVNVSLSPPPTLINTATVSGGGERNTANDTATDNAAGVGNTGPDLTITKTHTGTFQPGATGTYSITVTNHGTGPTSGTVTVTDSLPAGLTGISSIQAASPWTCSGTGTTVLTCTATTALAANASYPVITLNVSVAANPPISVTNTAAVSGGGDQNPGDNTAHDPTNIAVPTVTVSVGANFGGLSFTVDGVGYTSTQAFVWVVGSSHTVATTSPQTTRLSGTFTFQNWSDGSTDLTHMVTAPAATTSFIANFTQSFR